MGGVDGFREPIEVDAETFVGVKSFKAIGKRITTLHIGKVEELEPIKFPTPASPEPSLEGGGNEEELTPSDETEEVVDPYDGKSQQDVADEMNGQLRLDF